MATETPAVHDILRAFEEFGRAQREVGSRLTRSLDVPRASIGLLRYLNTHGPVQIGCAAQHFRVDLSVTSRQVSVLVDAGLATRDVDHDDRRARTVVLTDQGRAKVAELGEAVTALMSEIFEDWDPAELKTATDHITAIAQTITQHQGDPSQAAHHKDSKENV
ncbi:transcriptional regulator, MarR family [Sanguibacter gelidistatuariae]|uniref:Transcriptional regulator, MarR family n=1 Tax=Sanguibacter gelidistatuariae TaxID=1814289 RepID=A0A1G6HIR9_9MICO|nr:MarR family winged helix-turn-helix transcriptional regulator [Sanguibacter gelidistatuariae]SDB94094.1 transcriptional regulator, MarR family [Sanguibacter gelidistatuariae]